MDCLECIPEGLGCEDFFCPVHSEGTGEGEVQLGHKVPVKNYFDALSLF
jgi:hypothetical protein